MELRHGSSHIRITLIGANHAIAGSSHTEVTSLSLIHISYANMTNISDSSVHPKVLISQRPRINNAKNHERMVMETVAVIIHVGAVEKEGGVACMFYIGIPDFLDCIVVFSDLRCV